MTEVQDDFASLTAAVDALIAADEAENTLLANISSQLNAILANPQGIDPQAVVSLRDAVNAELVKVNTAITSAGGSAIPPNPGNLPGVADPVPAS